MPTRWRQVEPRASAIFPSRLVEARGASAPVPEARDVNPHRRASMKSIFPGISDIYGFKKLPLVCHAFESRISPQGDGWANGTYTSEVPAQVGHEELFAEVKAGRGEMTIMKRCAFELDWAAPLRVASPGISYMRALVQKASWQMR